MNIWGGRPENKSFLRGKQCGLKFVLGGNGAIPAKFLGDGACYKDFISLNTSYTWNRQIIIFSYLGTNRLLPLPILLNIPNSYNRIYIILSKYVEIIINSSRRIEHKTLACLWSQIYTLKIIKPNSTVL